MSWQLTVFLAAIAALAVMTVLSALLGFVVTTFIPREYTYYACTAIMFLFGQFSSAVQSFIYIHDFYNTIVHRHISWRWIMNGFRFTSLVDIIISSLFQENSEMNSI